jgi:hypothetical protein
MLAFYLLGQYAPDLCTAAGTAAVTGEATAATAATAAAGEAASAAAGEAAAAAGAGGGAGAAAAADTADKLTPAEVARFKSRCQSAVRRYWGDGKGGYDSDPGGWTGGRMRAWTGGWVYGCVRAWTGAW